MLRTPRSLTSPITRAVLAACVLTALALAPAFSQTPPFLSDGPPTDVSQLPPDTLDLAALASDVIPGRYIVVFKASVEDPPGLARQLVKQHGGRLHFTYTSAVKGFAAELPEPALAALRAHAEVAYI